jgi:hypothetical protein
MWREDGGSATSPLAPCSAAAFLESLTDDRRHIPVGDPMAKQALGLSKLVAKDPAGGELDLVSLLAERRDEGTSFAAARAMLFAVRRCLGQRPTMAVGKLADNRGNGRLWREPRDELVDAEREHRRRRAVEIELPLVDFAQMAQKLRFHAL